MSAVCPVHGQPWKVVPAGVSSKTGKPYNAFYVCPVQGCDQRPQRPNGQARPQQQYQPPPQQQKKPDWDAIAAGKVRHGLVVAMIEAGWDWDRIVSDLPRYAALVIGGVPQGDAAEPPVEEEPPWMRQ